MITNSGLVCYCYWHVTWYLDRCKRGKVARNMESDGPQGHVPTQQWNNMFVHLQHVQEEVRQDWGKHERHNKTHTQQLHTWAPKHGRLGNIAGHRQWSPSCAARVRAAGDLQGQPLLHNNAVLPKAFAWCHSSEFSKAKEAGEEERLEGERENQRSNKQSERNAAVS